MLSLTELDGSIFREENISGLDIAMDEAVTMQVLEAV